MNWKPILAVALLLVAAGAIVEMLVPAGGRIIDIGSAVFAAATWIVPPLRFVVGGNKKRASLAAVGFTIHVVFLAACLSAVGLLLALLTLVFAQTANWAWLAILGIAAFWVAGGVLLYVGDRRSPAAKRRGVE
jgi:hypothetical protein